MMPNSPEEHADTGPLRQEILADAAKRADRLRRSAKKDAGKILADAEENARAAADALLEKADADAAARARIELATVPLERRRMELAARQETIDAVFRDALDVLRARDYDVRDAIARLALAAAAEMRRTSLVLRVADADQHVLDDAFLDKLSQDAPPGISFEPGDPLPDTAGGVLVQTRDAREIFDNTFEARLRRLKESLRDVVASQLWPTGKTEVNA